ncbi:MAG: family 1 glycosylhydrolase [Patescibacteria group bacterium]
MKPWPTTKIFIVFFVFLGCSARKAEYEKDVGSDNFTYDLFEETPTNPSLIKWGLPISLMQLVTETVSEEICPSGWTELYKRFKSDGKAELVSLQPNYVKRFADLNEFNQTMDYAYPLVSGSFPVVRLTLAWPCFQNPTWQEKILQTVEHLQELGAEIELTLSHHDSYPALLETTDIMTTGWANENAAAKFANYSADVISVFEGKIPKGTVIYLINEPMGYLFNAYLGFGNWPPGGKKAAKTMAKALVNMREGLYLAAKKIKEAGYRAAIAKNLRPVLNRETPEAETLDYIFSWWLLKALLDGCIDDNFDGKCEEKREPAPIEILGITFYGTMKATTEIIDFGLPQKQTQPMSLPEYDFEPTPVYFQESVQGAIDLFGNNTEIGIAEIGFSSASIEKMAYWLFAYRKVIEDLYHQEEIKNRPFIQLHSLFESAEFSPGEWVFHLIGLCDENGCGLTPWGKKVIEIISE